MDQRIVTRTTVTEDGCWVWLGGRGGPDRRYGILRYKGSPVMAHRFAFRELVGPCDGLHIHHRCENTLCVNPAHLEALTNSAHQRLHDHAGARNRDKTHCPQGHPYSGENLYVVPTTGVRLCRECNRVRRRQASRAA